MFLIVGVAKLTGTLHTVQTFAAFGWGQWFRYVAGLLDLAGALLVLVPRWTFYGALVLTCMVGLGAVLSVTRPGRKAQRAPVPVTTTRRVQLRLPASSRTK